MKQVKYIFLSVMLMSCWVYFASAQESVERESVFSISITRTVRLGQTAMILGTLTWDGDNSQYFSINPLKTRVIDSDGELYDFRYITMEIGNLVVMDKSQFNTKTFELPNGIPVKVKIIVKDFNKYADVVKILELGYFGMEETELPEGKLSYRDLKIQ